MSDEKGFQQAKEARQKSYSPYSKFQVGACIVTEDGEYFQGANIENASYGATVCAERTAVFNGLLNSSNKKFTKIYLVTDPVATPCGMCLQVLSEFCNQDLDLILCDLDGVKEKKKLKDFLPNPFDKNALNK